MDTSKRKVNHTGNYFTVIPKRKVPVLSKTFASDKSVVSETRGKSLQSVCCSTVMYDGIFRPL